MEETNSFSTIIVHEVRLKLGLSCNEYCVVDLIDWSMKKRVGVSLAGRTLLRWWD